jgi:glutathione synthase/RimK-type ligase-like ATP-grasp enzyme
MTQEKTDLMKEFDALFRSLDEQYQQEALTILRTLSFAESTVPNPPQK